MRQTIYWNRICEVTTSTYPRGTLGSVVFFFKTTLYTSKEFLMGTISSRILHQLRYPVRRCRWNVVSNTYWLYIRVIWEGLITLRGHLCLLRSVLLILFMCLSVLSSVLWCLLRFQQQQQQQKKKLTIPCTLSRMQGFTCHRLFSSEKKCTLWECSKHIQF